ncbi:hypothetical protein [Brevibacillus fortis]|uniref:hypothetical protein n=1 Tax=Brevibacillus fortis TaxID=2126352 RepID=UPI0038FBE657
MPASFPKKPMISFLIILLSAVLLSACGAGNNAGSQTSSPAVTESASPAVSEPAVRTYKDAFGRSVEIPTSPKRIVAH